MSRSTVKVPPQPAAAEEFHQIMMTCVCVNACLPVHHKAGRTRVPSLETISLYS
jgi:hypothetical protein